MQPIHNIPTVSSSSTTDKIHYTGQPKNYDIDEDPDPDSAHDTINELLIPIQDYHRLPISCRVTE
jgi:hypothetical protein